MRHASAIHRRPVLAAGTCLLMGLSTYALAAPQSTDPERTLIAQPPVPRPETTPCEVRLFTDTVIAFGGFHEYAPPAGCPGPWAKVVLELDLSGPRPEHASTASISAWLDGLLLYRGAPQIHEGQAVWRVERDLTDYASRLTEAGSGELYHVWDNVAFIADDAPTITGTATLLFYPAAPSQPAPNIPDRLYSTSATPRPLPANIVRAYVDVIAQGINDSGDTSRFWYSCVPADAAASHPALTSMLTLGDFGRDVFSSPPQGCEGTAFREAQVLVDGQLAGIAPVYPWLSSNIHQELEDTVDRPVPGVQSINFVPYRVDLTPFAGLLSDGAPHSVEVRVAGDGAPPGQMDVDSVLLLYLDEGVSHVTGAVTRNTLDDGPGTPVVENGLSVDGDSLAGTIVTGLVRDGVIEGYVDGSEGRVHSSVRIRSRFSNTQDIRVDGLAYPDLRSYEQEVDLAINLLQRSRREQGGTLLGDDIVNHRYGLELDYGMDGHVEHGDEGDFLFPEAMEVDARQTRRVASLHYRDGMKGRYGSWLHDVFDARRSHSWDPEQDHAWESRRSYRFFDNRNGCYAKRLSTADGILTRVDLWPRCDGDDVRWFARPDGSPVSMGWAE